MPVALVHHRAREVGVAVEIRRDAVVVSETEDGSYVDRAHQIVDVNGSSHRSSLGKSTTHVRRR